jgi:cation diffusion facilitator family transporter
MVSVAADGVETLALVVVAAVTGSGAMRSQAAGAAGDVAVQVFLLIGVLSSTRPADEDHPLGYGRERFFWSFVAALGIFIGGGGFALQAALQAAVHPVTPTHYTIAYAVLAFALALDTLATETELRPLRRKARRRGLSLRALLKRSTDPAATTVVVSGASGVIGGVLAIVGLALSEATGSATPDTVAAMLIAIMLLVVSGLLLHTNRALLSGRGVPSPVLRDMRQVVARQRGVLEVPDLFAVVVGPSSLIVNGDVVFEDGLDVPAVEETIARSGTALGARWPSIKYVYLTPVAHARLTRGRPRFASRPDAARISGTKAPGRER